MSFIKHGARIQQSFTSGCQACVVDKLPLVRLVGTIANTQRNNNVIIFRRNDYVIITYMFARITSGAEHSHVAITIYHRTSNIIRTLVGNKIVYHSDVFGASPVGAAPTASSFST